MMRSIILTAGGKAPGCRKEKELFSLCHLTRSVLYQGIDPFHQIFDHPSTLGDMYAVKSERQLYSCEEYHNVVCYIIILLRYPPHSLGL